MRTRVLPYITGLPFLTLTDQYGVIYDFPESLSLKEGALSINGSIEKKIYAHGGAQTGDLYAKPRVLSIEGMLYADSATAMEAAFRALCLACYKGGILTLSSDTVSRYMTVEAPTIDSKWDRYPFARTLSIDFQTRFPFWIDTTETTETNVLASVDDFDVDCSGSDNIVSPTIEVASDQGVDVASILLRNFNDGGMAFEYNNPYFLAGNTLVINSTTGEIILNNNPAHEFLIRGAFLRLQPMVNSIHFEGSACTLTVKFRKVYT